MGDADSKRRVSLFLPCRYAPFGLRARAFEYAAVFRLTVIEEGECVVSVDKNSGSGRYDRIVPYSLGGTILTWLITRSAMKALSILMVDFSCALKLAMPISVLSAMRDASFYHISVKGGRFTEAVSNASTIVFDKTGTLTQASPKVAKIVTFDGRQEDEMPRLAACLEEHYPNSMAKAVAAEATLRELHHSERHSKVEYVAAHGFFISAKGADAPAERAAAQRAAKLFQLVKYNLRRLGCSIKELQSKSEALPKGWMVMFSLRNCSVQLRAIKRHFRRFGQNNSHGVGYFF